MQLHYSPTRLEFSVLERNAAQRAIMRLVTDFGLEIPSDKREWCMPLGNEVARIALETAQESSAKCANLAPAAISKSGELSALAANADSINTSTLKPMPLDTSVRLLATNSAGEKLLEVLNATLRLSWRDLKKGPTHLRHAVNRGQLESVLTVLK
jgi:hypothetical protein